MAYKLDGSPLAVDVPFKTSDGTQYPANWLRLASDKEKAALKITEISDDPVYDSRFYNSDGSAKALDDTKETIDKIEHTYYGVKTTLKTQEKQTAGSLLAPYDWYVVRKAEKSTAIPTAIQTYRDAVRTACDTREKEIDACSNTAALVTLYGFKEDGTPNMTQYPDEPSI